MSSTLSQTSISELNKTQRLKKIKTDALPDEKSIISPLLKEQSIRKSIVIIMTYIIYSINIYKDI